MRLAEQVEGLLEMANANKNKGDIPNFQLSATFLQLRILVSIAESLEKLAYSPILADARTKEGGSK